MSLFSRHRDDHNSSLSTPRRHDNRHHEKRTPVMMDMSKRPSFGQWLKVTWLDILTMAAMGAIGLGLYILPPAPSRSFPISFVDGTIVYPQFSYPLRHEIIPIYAAALLASLIPITIFLLFSLRLRSFWDLNNSILGLFYSLITAAVFQVFLKWLIGGLRPHFLTVCAPDISLMNELGTGTGFGQIMYDRSICTGEEKAINDSLESFPSGHSTAAFAGFIYLYFYLNAKLKVWSNYHPQMWKLVVTYAPVLGATLIAGSLTIDEFHNWYDCVAGAVIGTVMAMSAYRMVYRGVWDWRVNHIPLNRGGGEFSERDERFGDGLTMTRKAGWGGGNRRRGGEVHQVGSGGKKSDIGRRSEVRDGRRRSDAGNGYVVDQRGSRGYNGGNRRSSLPRKPVSVQYYGSHSRHGSDNMV